MIGRAKPVPARADAGVGAAAHCVVPGDQHVLRQRASIALPPGIAATFRMKPHQTVAASLAPTRQPADAG